MKKFNKNIENKKIEIMKNKGTYIKRVSIIFSCVILVLLITLFTFAKFLSNSNEYTLIHGKVIDSSTGDITLSYIVDGVAQSTPPAKGTGYKLKSATCTNADGVWSKSEWGLMVKNLTGKAKCNLEFERTTFAEVTIYSAALDDVYYYDDDNQKTIIGKTDATGKLTNVELKEDDITLYSSVAKTYDDLTVPYSKQFTIESDTEEVYLMPDHTFYWYGNLTNIGEECNTTNGWTNSSGYSIGSLTFNTNDVKTTNASGLGSKNAINGTTAKIIFKTNVGTAVLGTDAEKKFKHVRTSSVTNNTVVKASLDISTLGDIYVFTGAVYTWTVYIYAFWYE